MYMYTLDMSVNDKHYEPIDGRLLTIVIQNYRRKYDNRLRIKLFDTSGLFQ